MNIPATEDEEVVFEDWCEELGLHPVELTCTDPAGLWVMSAYGWGGGFGFEFEWGGVVTEAAADSDTTLV